jgi:murein DD-endopeptidase
MKLFLIFVFLFTVFPGMTRAEEQLVHMEVIATPSVVSTAKRQRLAYELHITNFSNATLRLLELSLIAGENDRILKELDAGDLAVATQVVASDMNSPDLNLMPGRRAVVYLDIDAPDKIFAETLSHALTVAGIESEESPTTVISAEAVISRDAPPVLGAPLSGGPWIAVYDPGLERGHRRVFYATEGKATLPGRFAIDFMKPDSEGRLSPDDGETPSTYYGFGAPVLAVADGLVVAVRDDMADPSLRSGRSRPSIGDASGNYVAIDIGGGLYAFYEHLRQGAPIKAGDLVRKGDVIGALGFTGSASVPHLHFHIADRLSVLGAEGRPFVFSRFERIGVYPSMEAVGDGPWSELDDNAQVTNVMPGPNVVIRFEAE